MERTEGGKARKAHASLLTLFGSAHMLAAAASFFLLVLLFGHTEHHSLPLPPSPSLCACFLLEDTHPVAMVSVVITSMDLIHSIYSKSLAWSILRLSSPSQGLEERPRDMEVQSNWSFCNNQHPHLPLGRSKAGRIYSS